MSFTKIDKVEWDLKSGIISIYAHSLKDQDIEYNKTPFAAQLCSLEY
jgi:hypothetical protein